MVIESRKGQGYKTTFSIVIILAFFLPEKN